MAATWVTSRTSPACAAGGEVAVAQHRLAGLERAALGAPLRQAAVEHRDVGLAEEPERPPDPRRAEHADAVVDDDAVAVADAHRPHPGDELLHRRRHVRQARLLVGDLVDVEEARAGDMRRLELGAGVAARRPACTSSRRGCAGRARSRCAASQSVETRSCGSLEFIGGPRVGGPPDNGERRRGKCGGRNAPPAPRTARGAALTTAYIPCKHVERRRSK